MIGPIILQIVLIILNAIFASAEIAVISMNETKLKKLAEDGNSQAIKLTALTSQPARFLATIQVAITLAGLLGSAFAADNFAKPLVNLILSTGVSIPESILKSISVFVITLILAYFNLVFGELVPKRIAMKKADSLALGMAKMLHLVAKLFAPLVFLLTISTNCILRLMGIDPNEEEEQVTEEEIRMLLMTGNKQGMIDKEETEMIENIFEFDDIPVEQLATHRIEIISLNASDELEEWEAIIHNSRHTYYPIYDEEIDNIIGVLDTKDYFRCKSKSKEYILSHATEKPYFIPESMKANSLFQSMKEKRTYFAFLIDEYGGLSGIITLHDLMEALVGHIYDIEEPIKPKEIEQLNEETWRIYGEADLAEVEKELGISLPTNLYHTFNGYVCSILGKIPNDDEGFTCETDSLKIQVHTVKNHKIIDTTVCAVDYKEAIDN